MKTTTAEALLKEVLDLSQGIHDRLEAHDEDYDSILNEMNRREDCLEALLPLLTPETKAKLIQILVMVRDRESEVLVPYHEELVVIEKALVAIKQLKTYRTGVGGEGSGGVGA